METSISHFKPLANPGGPRQQYFTPEWAAEALVGHMFPGLQKGHVVVEPTCGKGAFVKAVPDEVEVFGIEIDPALAEEARRNTGRPIFTSDFRLVDLPKPPTHVIGNPPFRKAFVDDLLDWSYDQLPKDGQVGFILPSYLMQFSRPVMEWHRKWAIRPTMIPKEIFPGLKHPLSFVLFEKKSRRTLTGMFLYDEANAIRDMARPAKLVLCTGRPRTSAWKALVEEALHSHGGKATLGQLYAWCGDRRPTQNIWWKEQIRATCQRHFERVKEATYRQAA